jgi:octaheme c-type cytochrome (tetrathionate reductase family)
MRRLAEVWLAVLAVVILIAVTLMTVNVREAHRRTPPRPRRAVTERAHLDHSPFLTGTYMTGQAVTRRCLECHPQAAAEIMQTSHWKWLGPEERLTGRATPVRMGKKNLLNNFCVGIQGNWPACTSCHAGYGWRDARFDFAQAENVDCLVCHDWSGAYAKGEAGLPMAGVDLLAVARSVGYPRRANCGACHFSGGGGMGVKHGDLDGSLTHPDAEDDVHMGRHGLQCIDCHRAQRHDIPGRAFSVSAGGANGVACEDCHAEPPHADARLNAHLASVACETCHIPKFARSLPTKMVWDWSQAGDAGRQDDPHTYLKIKGAFVYENNAQPSYR